MQDKIVDIVSNHQLYFQHFKESKKFSGPSLHFHLRAVQMSNPVINKQQIEYIYATLASWGMHRMGSNGAKMNDFKTFSDSIFSVSTIISELFPQVLSTFIKWPKLEIVFESVKSMNGATQLIGNSKTLAHLLPNLIPPFDRQYTLAFLQNHKNINVNNQKKLFIHFLQDFFQPLSQESVLISHYDKVRRESEWNTSFPKYLDNLVIGAILSRNQR